MIRLGAHVPHGPPVSGSSGELGFVNDLNLPTRATDGRHLD